MISVDTNILVRVFIDDLDHIHVEKARNLVKKSKHIYITQIVLVEMVWVLRRAYQLNKQQLVHILEEISGNSAFVVQNEKQFLEALLFYKNNNTDFSDCMILSASKEANIEHFYTFDTEFSKLSGVKKL